MEIDTELMAKFDTGLLDAAKKVPLSVGDLEAKVLPASLVQLSATAQMLGEMLDLRNLYIEIMRRDDSGGGNPLGIDEALAGKLIDLFERFPELREQWAAIMQPNTNVNVDRLTLFDFAAIAIAFVISSASGTQDRGWMDLGKSVTAAFGPTQVT